MWLVYLYIQITKQIHHPPHIFLNTNWFLFNRTHHIYKYNIHQYNGLFFFLLFCPFIIYFSFLLPSFFFFFYVITFSFLSILRKSNNNFFELLYFIFFLYYFAIRKESNCDMVVWRFTVKFYHRSDSFEQTHFNPLHLTAHPDYTLSLCLSQGRENCGGRSGGPRPEFQCASLR